MSLKKTIQILLLITCCNLYCQKDIISFIKKTSKEGNSELSEKLIDSFLVEKNHQLIYGELLLEKAKIERIKGNNNPDYFGYLFSTAFMKAEFRTKPYGIIDSRLRLYSDKFFSILAPVPPKTEQDKIVDHIKEQSKRIKHFPI